MRSSRNVLLHAHPPLQKNMDRTAISKLMTVTGHLQINVSVRVISSPTLDPGLQVRIRNLGDGHIVDAQCKDGGRESSGEIGPLKSDQASSADHGREQYLLRKQLAHDRRSCLYACCQTNPEGSITSRPTKRQEAVRRPSSR